MGKTNLEWWINTLIPVETPFTEYPQVYSLSRDTKNKLRSSERARIRKQIRQAILSVDKLRMDEREALALQILSLVQRYA